MFGPSIFLLVVSLHQLFVHADYTIDDSDYSELKFSENPAGPVWGPFGSHTGEVLQLRLPNGTMQTVDATQCYDGTYTYAACTTSDNCAVQFSFTGSGITIYVLQAGPQGMSASLSIDSGTATTVTLDAPLAPRYYSPRVVLFNIQNLQSGTHTAVMTVLDWSGSFSGMMLDYIEVNQAVVASRTTSSSTSTTPSVTPSQTSSPSSVQSRASANSQTAISQQQTSQSQMASPTGTRTSSGGSVVVSFTSAFPTELPSSISSGNATSSHSNSMETSNVAIVGGAIGGAIGLLALLGLVLFCFRRRSRLRTYKSRPHLLPRPATTSTNTNVTSINVGSSATPTLGRSSGTLTPLRPTESFMPSYGDRDLGSPSPAASMSHVREVSSIQDSISLSMSRSIGSVSMVGAQHLTEPASHPNEKSQAASSTSDAGIRQHPAPSARPDVPGARADTNLTNEQADFIHCLFNNNVPAPVVARVLELMVANPHASTSTSPNDREFRTHGNTESVVMSPWIPLARGVSWTPTLRDEETAPPSYDDVRRGL